MLRRSARGPGALRLGLLLGALNVLGTPARAQDHLRALPLYDHYRQMAGRIPQSVGQGALRVAWAADGGSLQYQLDGRWLSWDLREEQAREIPPPDSTARRGRRPDRGRQFESAFSPDSTLEAFHRDRNLWLREASGAGERAITSDGDEETRIKNGSASWVYGEELNQRTAMWWSPDAKRIAFYRFDESPVQDYFLQLDQTQLQSSMDVEAYPKAGTRNPVVDVYVHDLASGRNVRMDVRDGGPFADEVVGHYVYRVAWTPDGREITFNRTNRRQNVMELTACDPATGHCRVVVREEWPASWTENLPTMQYLSNGRRFIWSSERTGYRNFYLYDLDGTLLSTLTNHSFEVEDIAHVDERAGLLWYTARSGDNHMKMQLHRVTLDGRNDVRLTDPAFHHAVTVAPDGRHFVDIAQTHDQPPVTRLMDARGGELAELARADLTRFDSLGLERVELFTFTAADGITELHGLLHRPSNFDPSRKYPLLLSVYGGPDTNGARETFVFPHPFTEWDILLATVDARSAGGRGKRLLDAIYQKLGTVEIDDMAAAVRELAERPWVDAGRVGVYGTSYGGYAALMALLRHPDVFQAASASSPVTDWKHYDTIYTERYMWTPQGNPEGYRAGSALTWAKDLKGRLMLYFGTADNNVHPSNAMELIQTLQRADKSFELQIGPDRGHSAIDTDRMLEFFLIGTVFSLGGSGRSSIE